jgi:putative endonuclease
MFDLFGRIIAVHSDMGKESTILGKEGETIAIEYLVSHGYKIFGRNFRSQQGEIDIIAKDGDFLVFVEVKIYSIGSFGTPLGAVRRSKKESMIHAARTYLLKNNIKDTNCRFDVLAIYRSWKGLSSFDLIKDAFHVS